ncbi:MAG TPA: hypothetical protein ENK18_22265 [Deltaproteobacteria bacterium]|nr:hypothetical protein [Deltaproteobacteria bacterium]
MSTSFLLGFSQALIARLRADGLVEITEGQIPRVEVYLTNYLDTRARGCSLLSSVEAALLACPEVEELYVDLEQLKELVEDLR